MALLHTLTMMGGWILFGIGGLALLVSLTGAAAFVGVPLAIGAFSAAFGCWILWALFDIALNVRRLVANAQHEHLAARRSA